MTKKPTTLEHDPASEAQPTDGDPNHETYPTAIVVTDDGETTIERYDG